MEKTIKDIIKNIRVNRLIGDPFVRVNGIEIDSRELVQGNVFCALKGTRADGHRFIDRALQNGAVAILCEDLPAEINPNVVYIQVENAAIASGKMASAFYGFPSEKIKLIGITGTNGKTTTATLLYQLFRQQGKSVGLLSTVANYINDEKYDATHTTPDAIRLNKLLSEMHKEGCEYCFMEVSSHAIHQHRIAGLNFEGAVFTNISHDHLDYHGTFKDYIYAKKLFFDNLTSSSFAITNADDKNGQVMVQNTLAKVYSYGLKNMADYKCRILENCFEGMQLELNGREVWTQFIGKFNASNLTAVYAVARLLGLEEEEALLGLSVLKPVSGRFETIRSSTGKTVVVDYAHTPDALENVLKTICDLKKANEKIITVVGAGGDRDKTKRPLMAKIAAQYSDQVILTSDNPRTENPDQIIKEMQNGLDVSELKKALSIVDRKEAIKVAVVLASDKDLVLVAGKGHETYQEINGIKHHFDDKEQVKEFLNL